MRDRQTCVDCGKLSPETETNYTLISSQFGWRLSRWKSEDGAFHVEWRCADCWRDHKRAKQAQEERPSQMPTGQSSTVRPAPIQTRPLPSFPSRPPPSAAIGPLPPIPRPPGSRPGSRPPSRQPHQPHPATPVYPRKPTPR